MNAGIMNIKTTTASIIVTEIAQDPETDISKMIEDIAAIARTPVAAPKRLSIVTRPRQSSVNLRSPARDAFTGQRASFFTRVTSPYDYQPTIISKNLNQQ